MKKPAIKTKLSLAPESVRVLTSSVNDLQLKQVIGGATQDASSRPHAC